MDLPLWATKITPDAALPYRQQGPGFLERAIVRFAWRVERGLFIVIDREFGCACLSHVDLPFWAWPWPGYRLQKAIVWAVEG